MYFTITQAVINNPLLPTDVSKGKRLKFSLQLMVQVHTLVKLVVLLQMQESYLLHTLLSGLLKNLKQLMRLIQKMSSTQVMMVNQKGVL